MAMENLVSLADFAVGTGDRVGANVANDTARKIFGVKQPDLRGHYQ
jgi:hypothetical protein